MSGVECFFQSESLHDVGDLWQMIEMRVRRDQRSHVLNGQSRDPDIVLGNGFSDGSQVFLESCVVEAGGRLHMQDSNHGFA